MAVGRDQGCRHGAVHTRLTAVHGCGFQVQERRVLFAKVMR